MVSAEVQQSEQQLACAVDAGTQADGAAVRQVPDIHDTTSPLGESVRGWDAGWLRERLGSPQPENPWQAEETQVCGGLQGDGVGRYVCMWAARHNSLCVHCVNLCR